MSDGPYRSLPMSRSWKRLAEFSENENFGRADVCAAMLHALEVNWRAKVPTLIREAVRDVFLEKQGGLFADGRIKKVETLAPETAGFGFGRLFVEHVLDVLHEGRSGEAGLLEATTKALKGYAARAARQIEEHYCRKAPAALTKLVRGRIEEAARAADVDALARQLCGLEPAAAKRRSLKHRGIDEGVPL